MLILCKMMVYSCVALYAFCMYPHLICNVDVMISTLQKRLQDALLSLVGPSSSFWIGFTRHFDNGKTRLAKPPDAPTNPDRSCTYLVLRAQRMSQTSGWHRPWLPRGHRLVGPTLVGALVRGFKIKMTLGLAKTRGKRLRWQLVKPSVVELSQQMSSS